MIYLFILILLGICWIAPLPVQIVLFVINAFVPDVVPVIDELLMTVAIMNRIRKYVIIRNFIRAHKILSLLLSIVIVVGVICVIQWLIGIV